MASVFSGHTTFVDYRHTAVVSQALPLAAVLLCTHAIAYTHSGHLDILRLDDFVPCGMGRRNARTHKASVKTAGIRTHTGSAAVNKHYRDCTRQSPQCPPSPRSHGPPRCRHGPPTTQVRVRNSQPPSGPFAPGWCKQSKTIYQINLVKKIYQPWPNWQLGKAAQRGALNRIALVCPHTCACNAVLRAPPFKAPSKAHFLKD